jgi:hypothetical protein
MRKSSTLFAKTAKENVRKSWRTFSLTNADFFVNNKKTKRSASCEAMGDILIFFADLRKTSPK